MKDFVGQTIAGCRIVRKIGEGGMGIVYEAEQSSLGRNVAIKFLVPGLVDDKDFIARFFREARSAAKLSHPNVLHIYSVGEQDGVIYMVMEYIKGRTLRSILNEKGALPEQEALPIVRDIASALLEAEKNNIVHRDLKPENIMITENGHVKVMDFGLAKNITGDTQCVTSTGVVLGTPQYMSPEQVNGEQVDIRSDIYSLGLILFCAITGKPAYGGKTPASIFHDQVYTPLPDLKALNPRASDGVCKLNIKMTKKNPQERFQSASEVVSAIELLQKDARTFSQRFKKEKRETAVLTVRRKRPYAYVAAGVLGAAIVSGVLFFAFTRTGKIAGTEAAGPGRPGAEKKSYAEYMKEGDEHLNAKEWDKALAVFRLAGDEYPGEPGTQMWINLAKRKRQSDSLKPVSSEVVAPGVLTVVTAPFAGFYYKTPDGRQEGFDVDLLTAFANRAGLSARFVEKDEYRQLIPELLDRKADIIGAGMTVTVEREQIINFSSAYFTNTQVLVTRGDTSGIETKEDLAGKSIGYLPDTTYETTVKSVITKKAVPLKNWDEMVERLTRGEIDGFIDDLPSALMLVKQQPGLEIGFTFEEIDHFAYGLRKDTPHLQQAINLFLEEYEATGLLKQLYEKYYGE